MRVKRDGTGGLRKRTKKKKKEASGCPTYSTLLRYFGPLPLDFGLLGVILTTSYPTIWVPLITLPVNVSVRMVSLADFLLDTSRNFFYCII